MNGAVTNIRDFTRKYNIKIFANFIVIVYGVVV